MICVGQIVTASNGDRASICSTMTRDAQTKLIGVQYPITGAELWNLRKIKLDLTQEEFAKLVDCSRKTIIRAEEEPTKVISDQLDLKIEFALLMKKIPQHPGKEISRSPKR